MTKQNSGNHKMPGQPAFQPPFIRHFKNLPIPGKLGLMIGVFCVIIFILLSIANVGVAIMSDVRATVGGEGLWSKAQKDAVYYLMRYTIFHEEKDFQKYQDYLAIPMGDRKARHELSQAHSNLHVAGQGFIEGRNDPEDVLGIGRLFKYFNFLPHVRTALGAWIKADEKLDDLISLGKEIRTVVSSKNITEEKTKDFLVQIGKINDELTPLEDKFSYTLGEGARWLKNVLFWVMFVTTVLLLALGINIAIAIAKHLIGEIHRLREASERVARGDFDHPIEVPSSDEIGDLARSFGKMAQQRKEAEKMLAERAKELDVANKKLIETERMKDEFFATVSHELRTPLTLVLSPAESLLANEYGEISPGQRRILETMHNNAVRLLQMVTGLLDFSKLEAGRVEVKREALNLTLLTGSILDDFKPTMAAKHLNLKWEPALSSVLALMDRYLFERIVFNLLANAVKFTPEGGRITVSLEQTKDRVWLKVSDTGIGISQENQKLLFEKFRQLEGAATRRFEGTGLGLALVKEFSELLNGKVSVESETGQGSTFIVECEAPQVEKEMPSANQAPRPKRAQQFLGHLTPIDRPQLKSKEILSKILIAEDNSELAAYISDQLYAVAEMKLAKDGDEALEYVQTWKPDLIISDVMMPKRDGLSLCRAVKSNPQTTSIPVVLLTALTHREALLKGWEAGADEYLFKPFHPKELITRILSILNLTRARRQMEATLLSVNQELEEHVAQKTKALVQINEQLKSEILERIQIETRQTQLMSELTATNRELNDFAHIVSHDLKTPLRGISTLSEWLLEDYSNGGEEKTKEHLHLLQDRVKRLYYLVEGILEYSSVGRSQEEKADIDLNLVFQNVVESIAAPARIHIELKQPLPVLHANLTRMTQVFQNLIQNAVSHMDKPEGLIEVDYKGREHQWQFCISDNGVGIDSKYFSKIFMLFQTLGPVKNEKSTGIGLAVVKKIIENYGGQIWVESSPGNGAKFFFTLPKTTSAELHAVEHHVSGPAKR